MARKIYLINPGKKTKKRKANSMAKKKGKKKSAGKRKYKRNPGKKAKRAVKYVKSSFMGLNFKNAMSGIFWTQSGMFGAKWMAKRFGADANETDPGSWDWSSYAKGAGGAIITAILANMVKPGKGQKVLEGGLNYVIFKAIQNELITQSDWAQEQFGADDDYTPDEYLLTGEDDWFLGADGNMYPSDERHRLPSAGYGDTLEPVGPLGFGDVLEPVGPLGESDPFKEAWF